MAIKSYRKVGWLKTSLVKKILHALFAAWLMLNALSVSASTLLVVGDSLSAGYGLQTEQSWVYLLKQKFQNSRPDVDVINAAISGATTAQGLSQLPALLKQHKPSWLVLELGANDGLQGKPLKYIENNLRRLIEQARQSGSEVLLVGIQLPPNLGKRYTQPFYQLYVDLAREYQLEFVPFLLEGVAGNPALMQKDGLHPKADASEMILQNVWPHLMKLMGGASFGSGQ